MRETFYKCLGRISLIIWYPYLMLRKRRAARVSDDSVTPEFDKSGLVAREAPRLEVLFKDSGVFYVGYDNLSHSYARAPEFYLYEKYLGMLKRPLLDFGCGDGSFSSVLFKKVDYGIDKDPEALAAAGKYGIYKKLLSDSTKVNSCSIKSVYSNSVLEHLHDLDGALFEINRVLEPGGVFIFTVPVSALSDYLCKYFGRWFSREMNVLYCHYNLLGMDEWKQVLEKHGFTVTLQKSYHPDWSIFWIIMTTLINNRLLGRLVQGLEERVWQRYKASIIEMARKSVSESGPGANMFCVVQKGSGKPA